MPDPVLFYLNQVERLAIDTIAAVGAARRHLRGIRGDGGVGGVPAGVPRDPKEKGEEDKAVQEAAEAFKQSRDKLWGKFRDGETDEITEAGQAVLEDGWMSDGVPGQGHHGV